MTAIESSWLIGSFVLEAAATIVVNGGSNAVIPAGTYYLRDPTAANSLIDEILTQVAPFMTDEAIFIAEDRKLRVTASVAFTWTIPAALQDILGFGASIPSTTSATATNISTLLWSPGWCATTSGHPGGVTGWTESTRVHTTSASGLTQRVTLHGTDRTQTSLAWRFVLRDRAWSSGEDTGLPGEYRRFFLDVLDPGQRWKLYPETTEDSASSSSVTYPTPLGPYVARDLVNPWWARSISNADTHTDIGLDGTLVSELA